jgi:hypothetical protein
MAHKMKGFPMMDTSSKHGTNKNYNKSGAPGIMDFLNPVNAIKALRGKGGNCPPAAGQPAPVVGAAQPVAPVTPTAPATPAAPVVDPNAPPVPMKENLKVGAPKH